MSGHAPVEYPFLKSEDEDAIVDLIGREFCKREVIANFLGLLIITSHSVRRGSHASQCFFYVRIGLTNDFVREFVRLYVRNASDTSVGAFVGGALVGVVILHDYTAAQPVGLSLSLIHSLSLSLSHLSSLCCRHD